MTVTGETRVHPEELKTTYERLSKAFESVDDLECRSPASAFTDEDILRIWRI